jgi:plastocyanin
MYRTLLVLTGLTLAGALVALTAAPTQAQQDQEVSLRDFAIEPASFTATAGQTVRLSVTNTGAVQHNLAFEPPSGEPGQALFSANLRPGQSETAEFTFTQSGTWTMYCPVGSHRARGMAGSVEAQDAASAPDASETVADPGTAAAPSAPDTTNTTDAPAAAPPPPPPPPPPPTNTPAPPPPSQPSRRPGY